MKKESYNIDDILSEVKKRREENETEIKQGKTFTDVNENKEQIKKDAADEKKEQANEPVEPKETKSADEKTDPELEKKADLEQKKVKADDGKKETLSPAVDSADDKSENDMVNLIELSQTAQETDFAENEYKEPDADKKKKRNKAAKTVIIILVVLIVIAGIVAAVVANGMLNRITEDSNKNNTTYSQWTGMDKLVENFDPIDETEASELASLQDMIKTWYYNGAPASSSHILNVLLIGEDTRGKEILDEGTRADSAIIVSVNIDTKQITLTSILRDTYAYWESTPGDETTGQFGKINGAMAINNGNVNTYINCIERLYKINIDNYVIVNFDSFEDIVDSLGGVTLELTSREINEINNHPKRYGNVVIEKTFDGDEGELKLTGKQALAYCRIRKLDSDNKRADRQKTCLIEIFKETQNASTSRTIKVVNALLPYVKTGFNKNDVLKIARYALSQNWLGFDPVMNTIPDSRINEKGAGGKYYGAWCWKSDFPQDAYNLQMRIYGKSNITLAHTRVDVLKCAEKGFYKDGASPVWATITNYNYGETTTLETTQKEEESKKEE